MGITTKDIARICGVSRGTVDRALNNKPRIDPETKARILKVAEDLGYRPDLLARSLSVGKSMSLGVIVFDIRNRYFAQMVNSIELTSKSYDYFVNITLQENDPAMENVLLDNLVDRRIDGIILCPVNKGEDFARKLRALPVPVITIGNKVADDLPYIGIDEAQAAYDAIAYIITKGYKRILFVCPSLADKRDQNIYSHEQRLIGFKKAVADFNLNDYEIVGDWQYIDKTAALITESKVKPAVFCSGDTFALQIMKQMRQMSLYPPEDYGIMGFDGIDTLDYVLPQLATVFNPVEAIGVDAARCLINMIDGKPFGKPQLIPYEIVKGDSL